MGDLDLAEYCRKLKKTLDHLTNIDSPLPKRTLVTYLLNGLSKKYNNIINVIKHQIPFSTFAKAQLMLDMDENHFAKQVKPQPNQFTLNSHLLPPFSTHPLIKNNMFHATTINFLVNKAEHSKTVGMEDIIIMDQDATSTTCGISITIIRRSEAMDHYNGHIRHMVHLHLLQSTSLRNQHISHILPTVFLVHTSISHKTWLIWRTEYIPMHHRWLLLKSPDRNHQCFLRHDSAKPWRF